MSRVGGLHVGAVAGKVVNVNVAVVSGHARDLQLAEKLAAPIVELTACCLQ